MEAVLMILLSIGFALAMGGATANISIPQVIFGWGVAVMVFVGATLTFAEIKQVRNILELSQVVSVECQEEVK